MVCLFSIFELSFQKLLVTSKYTYVIITLYYIILEEVLLAVQETSLIDTS